ncbi:10798_t:CDS:2, partial [Dentiscutata heterogama]
DVISPKKRKIWSKIVWSDQDHQIICPKRRLTCPAFVSFLSAISKFEQPYWKIYGEKYAEFSLSLVESNCPPTLKELTKLQILQ